METGLKSWRFLIQDAKHLHPHTQINPSWKYSIIRQGLVLDAFRCWFLVWFLRASTTLHQVKLEQVWSSTVWTNWQEQFVLRCKQCQAVRKSWKSDLTTIHFVKIKLMQPVGIHVRKGKPLGWIPGVPLIEGTQILSWNYFSMVTFFSRSPNWNLLFKTQRSFLPCFCTAFLWMLLTLEEASP